MGYELSEKSRKKLEGVEPDLVAVVELAISRTDQDFCVGEGLRTIERQKMLVETGKSQTMNSRHITGHAVDLWVLVKGKVNWEMPRYKKLAALVLDCAKELGVPVEWGGNWRTFKDGPHFQLSKDWKPKA
jgi:peptidoglycan L-alanyl-D-glutamate endopeptidase CwlK